MSIFGREKKIFRKEKEKKDNKDNQYEDMDGYIRWKGSDKLVHIYVAERFILKRKIKPDEEIHHIDYNKKHNSSKNLLVMKRENHRKLHRRLNKINRSEK